MTFLTCLFFAISLWYRVLSALEFFSDQFWAVTNYVVLSPFVFFRQ